MTGVVFDIKEMAVHDGPGLRTTVFLKGCPLRCRWCHNPEGLRAEPQLTVREHACRHCGLCRRPCTHPDCQPYGRCLHICPDDLIRVVGERMTADDLAARLNRGKDLYRNGGGVTFSGGEPLMQASFLCEVLDRLDGIDAAMETSGYAEPETFRKVARKMALVYFDLKLADEELHRKYTGVGNARILRNLDWLRQSGIPVILRTPTVPGITDTPENRAAIAVLAGDLPHEWLPYNELAGAKYPLVGMVYPLSDEP